MSQKLGWCFGIRRQKKDCILTRQKLKECFSTFEIELIFMNVHSFGQEGQRSVKIKSSVLCLVIIKAKSHPEPIKSLSILNLHSEFIILFSDSSANLLLDR